MKATRDARPVQSAGLVVLTLLFLTTVSLSAQDWSDREARASLTIGPGWHGGASMILDSPKGFEIKPTFSWKAEVHTTYPLTPVIAAGLGIGYERRGTYMHVFDQPDNGNHNRIGYLFLHPHFSFSGFSIGTVFGFPMSETEDAMFGSGEGAEVMIEPRLEGIISLADMKDGWVSMVIGGGYSVTPYFDIPSSDFSGNWNHVSAYLGLRYEFTIPDTERD